MNFNIERQNGTLPFVTSAPLAPEGIKPRSMAVEVEELDDDLVDFWRKEVQPIINQSPPSIPRADRGWDWRFITNINQRLAFRSRPVGYALTTVVDDETIPLAMVYVLRRYGAFDGASEHASYLWFLSNAPDEYLKPIFHRDIPKALGQLALDVAVTTAYQSGMQGRLGLHAAPAGGDELLTWYKNRCMREYSEMASLPNWIRRMLGNDGRYRFFDVQRASEFSASLDQFRS